MDWMLAGVWSIAAVSKIVVNVWVIIHPSLTVSQLHTKYKTINKVVENYYIQLGELIKK